MDRLLSAAELSARFGVGADVLCRLAGAAAIPSVDFVDGPRFDPEGVEGALTTLSFIAPAWDERLRRRAERKRSRPCASV